MSYMVNEKEIMEADQMIDAAREFASYEVSAEMVARLESLADSARKLAEETKIELESELKKERQEKMDFYRGSYDKDSKSLMEALDDLAYTAGLCSGQPGHYSKTWDYVDIKGGMYKISYALTIEEEMA